MLGKRDMTRIVRTSSGIEIDPTGKAPGRGAYLHNRMECWEQAIKGSLARSLRVPMSEQDLAMLASFVDDNLQNQNG